MELAEVMSRVKEHTLGCSSGTSGAGGKLRLWRRRPLLEYLDLVLIF